MITVTAIRILSSEYLVFVKCLLWSFLLFEQRAFIISMEEDQQKQIEVLKSKIAILRAVKVMRMVLSNRIVMS